ncbi:hypothetical protein UPYG_G00012980 [Umbra pygmaea]|uniref:Uncharacterized protein n=1 Tax=Umbra pygmaea TaxID=75934 RepID=A0ABD0XIZ2_UMBPY
MLSSPGASVGHLLQAVPTSVRAKVQLPGPQKHYTQLLFFWDPRKDDFTVITKKAHQPMYPLQQLSSSHLPYRSSNFNSSITVRFGSASVCCGSLYSPLRLIGCSNQPSVSQEYKLTALTSLSHI